MGAGPPDVEVVAVDHDGQRQAAADGLGEDHDVWDDTAVLDGPEAAGAAHASSDLVGDQRDRAGGGDLPHAAQPAVGGGEDTPLALDGFEEHAGGQRCSGLGVVEDGLGPAGGEFGAAFATDAERAAVLLRIGQACRPEVAGGRGRFEDRGVQVGVGAGEGEQAGASGGGPHQSAGGFDRVRAGGAAEPDAGAVRELRWEGAEQFGGEGVLGGRGHVEDVQRSTRGDRLADGFEDDWVIVAEGEGAGAGQTVEVAATVGVLDGQPPRAYGNHGQEARVGACRRVPGGLRPRNPSVPRPHGTCPVVLPSWAGRFALGSRTSSLGLTSHRRHRRLGHRHCCTSSHGSSEASRQGSPNTGGSPARTNDETGTGKRVGRKYVPRRRLCRSGPIRPGPADRASDPCAVVHGVCP